VLSRAALAAAGGLTGPGIVEDADSSTVVLPGDRASLDPQGHVIIEIAQEAG
jgi:N-methylhydantoinase A/oxoprolinase/acetone carboxylase beta subunit